jgi:hypothetical protein
MDTKFTPIELFFVAAGTTAGQVFAEAAEQVAMSPHGARHGIMLAFSALGWLLYRIFKGKTK